jgi:K+-transporting ATPase ATPase B chain
MTRRPRLSVLRTEILLPALSSAAAKLHPRRMAHNPVMFTVEVGATLTTLLWLAQVTGVNVGGTVGDPSWFTAAIAGWLWLTAYFGNLAEAIAEGRG